MGFQQVTFGRQREHMNDWKRELPFIQILAVDNFLVGLEYLVGMKCPGTRFTIQCLYSPLQLT